MRKWTLLILLAAFALPLSAQVRAKVTRRQGKVLASATTATQHSVSLNWQESATGVTFNVYRGTSAGAEVILASGIVPLTYTDSSVANGQTYFYFVTAVGTGGESGPSNEISVQIPSPPPAPTALTGSVK